MVNRYIPGAGLDEILIQIADPLGTPVTTFLHKDRLGSVIAQTDDSGVVLEKYIYSPFGATPSLAGTVFGFTGQRYDAEIGLYNYRARYYAPSIGRFIQPDLRGFASGTNLYSYVGNDPTNYVDPSGWVPTPLLPETRRDAYYEENLAPNSPAGQDKRLRDYLLKNDDQMNEQQMKKLFPELQQKDLKPRQLKKLKKLLKEDEMEREQQEEERRKFEEEKQKQEEEENSRCA